MPNHPWPPVPPPTRSPFAAPSQELQEAALALYRVRAERYDRELAPFEPLRRLAVARLGLRPGQTVLDLGCGTGLSLPLLHEAVGPGGQVVGVEQCAHMLAQARQRVDEAGLSGVTLLHAPVEEAPLDGWADAACFHFTHDILLSPQALARVMRHLRPGAQVVATGLQWAPAWAWLANCWVYGAAWYSISSLQQLHAPWQLLAAVVPELVVEPVWQGAVFIAHGRIPG